MLVKNISEIPTDHYVSEQAEIAPIDRKKVASMESITEDITSHSTEPNWRQHMCVGVFVKMKDGRSFMLAQDSLRAALDGGGNYYVCYPNGEYIEPVTLETFMRRQEREEDEGFWDYY